MASRVEKLMPVPYIALVKSFEGRAGGKYQVERELWNASFVRFLFPSAPVHRLQHLARRPPPAFFLRQVLDL